MSNKVVESLTKRDIKRDNLSPKIIESQLTAVRDLIQVNRDQLSTHGIETVVLSSKLKPTSRYDAYFEFDDFRGIINLTSIGLLKDRSGGLFLNIYYNDNDKKTKGSHLQLVHLQTAQSPELADENEVLWLSEFSPKLLKQIAKLVKSASPISEQRFLSFF